MKKVLYSFLSIATVLLFACSGGNHEGQTEDNAEDTESHEGHDHAMGEENAELPEVSPPEGARIFFDNLTDGQKVQSPFTVNFGAEGIQVHPAGELIDNTGHHHVIINEGPTPIGVVVPADESHIHFGGGQMETELNLEPGEYTLTLQFADGLHRSYGERLSSTIHITVEAAQ